MKKFLFFITIIALTCSNVFGQIPQYYVGGLGTGSGNSFPFNSTSSNQVQLLYFTNHANPVNNFNAVPPTGFITKVYIKPQSTGTFSYANVTIKMANTTLTTLTSGTWNSGLTTVYSGPFTFTATANQFTGITLNTPFYFDNTQQLLVEISQSASTGMILNFTNGTPNTRMYGSSSSGSSNGADQEVYHFGIDIFACYPCTDTPKSLVNAPVRVCPNRPFTVAPATFYANATYLWQYSLNGFTWSNFTGPLGLYGDIVDSITAPKWYRCKISCTANNFSYLTPARMVDISPFYYCYCNTSTATGTSGLDVGNVKVISKVTGAKKLDWGNGAPLLNNSNANKKYSSFQDSVAPVILYRDTAYRAEITQINSAGSPSAGIAAMFIDYNRDGLFDTVTERVMNKAITSPTGMDSNTFVVPNNAEIGLTGLRVILRDNGQSEPCTDYGSGETEDYLAEIRYEPCSGPANAGNVEGDTSMCVGYDYVVYDTTYERRKSEINRTWQVSADNVLWFNAPSGANKDTLMRIFAGQPLYYRLRTDCVPSTDTTYSAPMLVNAKAGYKCYCFSQAVGGKLFDSSDIGAYSLAGYVSNDGGAHLLNAKATHKRQDHTDESPILIDVDSMYAIKVFHTMKSDLHGDAKITIFMDFNNNHQYDIPDERVFTGFTSVGNFTLIDYLNVPKTTILNTPTGMRVILNNDIAPNIPSDEACGTYTSGETEDYIVKFIQPFPASVNEFAGINHLSIYPNPTSGKFRLEFSGSRNVDKVSITILDVTGRKLKELNYQNNGNQFGTDIDLGNEAKGIYFVEVKTGNEKKIERVTIR